MLRTSTVFGLAVIVWTGTMARGEQPIEVKTDHWGDPLPAGARARLGTIRWRHGDGIQEVVFSPNGKYLASRGRDHRIRLFEASTGKLVQQFHEIDTVYNALAFSPDGKHLAAAAGNGPTSNDFGVRVWDLETGREVSRRIDADRPLFNLAFSPEGRCLQAVSCNAIFTWNLDTGRKVQRREWKNTIACSAFVPDGQSVVISADGEGSTLLRLETATGKVVQRMPGLNQPPQALAFSDDGTFLAAANPFEPTRLYRLADDSYRNLGEKSASVALAFSHDGKRLATVSLGGVVRLWNVDTSEEIRKLEGYHGWTNGLCFSPDGQTLALAGLDSRRVILWNVDTGHLRNAEDGPHGPIFSLALSRDGKLLASGGGQWNEAQGPLHLWDLTKGKEIPALPEIRGPIVDLAFSPEGHCLAIGSDVVSHVQVWDIAHGTEKALRASAAAADQRSTTLAFSSTMIAAGTTEGKIVLWDRQTGKTRGNFESQDSRMTALAFSPDGQRLATASLDRTVAIWKVDGHQEILRLSDFADSPIALAFSPDGTTLAVGSCESAQNIRLFDVATGRECRRFGDNHGRLRDLAFSPDGLLLVAGYNDSTVCLWESASGKERRCFRGHLGGIHAVAFAPDGQTVLSAGEDTSILIWEVAETSANSRILSKQSLENLWNELASTDGKRADRAIWQLVRRPNQAVTFLEKHLRLPQALTANQLTRLIRDLDDDQYAVREGAARELARHGEMVAAELRRHLAAAPSLEAFRRLDLLLRRIDSTVCPDHIRTARALEILERFGGEDVVHLLQKQIPEDGTDWLKREVQAILQRLERR